MPSTTYQSMAGVDVLDTEYALPGMPRVPRGDVTLVFGDGAIGKGRLIMSWVAEVINGDPEAVVIMILPEDHPNEQVAPRIKAAGVSDPSRVINLTRLPGGARFKLSADLTHEGHLGMLREAVETINTPEKGKPRRRVRMIVIDPLASVIGFGSIQSNAGARRVVEPIQDLSQDTGIATVIVAHTVKDGQLQGSAGLRQAARLVYKVSRDRANPLVKVISVDKANNLPPTEDLKFTIEEDDSGIIRVVMLDAAEIDRRQRDWRETKYRAVISMDGGKVIRPLGDYPSELAAKIAASAQPECPGPFLMDWHQALKIDKTPVPKTIATTVYADGTTDPGDGTKDVVCSFAITHVAGPAKAA